MDVPRFVLTKLRPWPCIWLVAMEMDGMAMQRGRRATERSEPGGAVGDPPRGGDTG